MACRCLLHPFKRVCECVRVCTHVGGGCALVYPCEGILFTQKPCFMYKRHGNVAAALSMSKLISNVCSESVHVLAWKSAWVNRSLWGLDKKVAWASSDSLHTHTRTHAQMHSTPSYQVIPITRLDSQFLWSNLGSVTVDFYEALVQWAVELGLLYVFSRQTTSPHTS